MSKPLKKMSAVLEFARERHGYAVDKTDDVDMRTWFCVLHPAVIQTVRKLRKYFAASSAPKARPPW